MATATVFPASAELTQLADQVREQFLVTVKQGNDLALSAVNSWSKAVSAIPMPELPEMPGVPALADFSAVTTYSFDLAIELLNIQRDFALQVGSALMPAKSA